MIFELLYTESIHIQTDRQTDTVDRKINIFIKFYKLVNFNCHSMERKV